MSKIIRKLIAKILKLFPVLQDEIFIKIYEEVYNVKVDSWVIK